MYLVTNFVNMFTKKFFCFNGRAGRKEFWMFFLAVFIVNTILGFIPKVGPILQAVFSLVNLFPFLGVTARRLHDQGKSGWLQLLYLVPFIGGLIVLILCIPAGNPEANQYGEAPACDCGCEQK